MKFGIQPILENEYFKLSPLKETDFEKLLQVASDPKVWEQHPNKDRYKREVFQVFFKGAVQSGGAFIIIDKNSDEILGSTRFYDFNEINNSILIGYTFYGTKSWGKNINAQVKTLMLDYIFQFVDEVLFHVGNQNFRSRKAMEKLGAIEIGQEEIAYFGEEPKTNIVYQITKQHWQILQKQ